MVTTTTISEEEKAQRIWQEIIQADHTTNALTELRPGEKTVSMYAKETNRHQNSARDHLNALVEDGVLRRRKVKLGQARGYAYYPVALYPD